jgi:hypothetical protein
MRRFENILVSLDSYNELVRREEIENLRENI